MIRELKQLFGFGPKPSVEEDALEEAQLLERDILNRELQLIDDHCRIEAQKRKKQFLLDWLQRETPKSVGN